MLSTPNIVMTDKGWMSAYELNKEKETTKVLSLIDNKWALMPILNISKLDKTNPFECKGHGHPSFYISKNDNELLTTKYERVWNKEERRNVRQFTNPCFVKASDLEGRFWASPLNISDREVGIPIDEKNDYFWFIGYYLGQGIREKGNALSLKSHPDNAKKLEDIMTKLGMFFKKDKFGSFHEYNITNKQWTDFLFKEFPKTNWKITIPYWIYSINIDCKKALFDGFIESIGVRSESNQKATTKDKGLAIAMKLISQELGHSVGMYTGKVMDENQSWRIVSEESARSSIVIDDYRYGLIREIKEKKDQLMYQWELEIEDCSGILVDGIVLK